MPVKPQLDRIRISAPVTPFAENGDLMTDAFEEIVRWHLDHGTRGFLIAADNGEHWALSPKEITRLTEITMRATGAALPVYVGAWAITARETIERAAAAAAGGAYGLCVKPQFYVHSWAAATEADIVGRFEAVARAIPLPMMIYNSFNRTNVNISHEILHKICDAVDADCLKDTVGDVDFIMERVLRFGQRLAVLVAERHFPMAQMLGAAGFIGTNSDLLGDQADELFGFESLSVPARRAMQVKQYELSRAINTFGTIPAAYKAAWNMVGLPAGHLRDPVRPISPEQEEELRAVLVKHGAIRPETARPRASGAGLAAAAAHAEPPSLERIGGKHR